MKKIGVFVQVCIVFSVLSTTVSCAFITPSVSVVHKDPSISWQEHAMLLPIATTKTGLVYVYGIGDPKSYFMGRPVLDLTIDCNVVGLIPPGHQKIYTKFKASASHDISDLPQIIEYDFQAGKRYVAVAHISGNFLLAKGNVVIYTIDEFRDVYAELYPEDDGSSFKSWVLDRFDKAEAELNK